MLVPTIGIFFTPLPLKQAFLTTDPQRAISQRRFVAPSFNGTSPSLSSRSNEQDIRRLLATAQLLALTTHSSHSTRLQLITFDGDVTLYPDGSTLLPNNPVIHHLVELLSRGLHIGIVTAAGYPDRSGKDYARRLIGLIDSLRHSSLSPHLKSNLAILGGECNYLFKYNGHNDRLEWVDEKEWKLSEMQLWKEHDIQTLLDVAEDSLKQCIHSLGLKATVIRKPRAVGMVSDNSKLTRECLEEAVLASQRTLSHHPVAQEIPFCCFNGGSDVWVDVGDKSLGVNVLQTYFHQAKDKCQIWGGNTLHVGDQFMSLGGNDFKAV